MVHSNIFKLFYSPRSPFARRIRLALIRNQLNFTEIELKNMFEPNLELENLNPLGLVPTLITPEGIALSDSAMLLEHLDELTKNIWPKDTFKRLKVKQASILCAGIMQSAVLYFQELKLHEQPSERWLKEHLSCIHDTLNFISSFDETVWLHDHKITQAGFDLCVALEYLDLRNPEINWREQYASLTTILNLARNLDYFVKSTPSLS